jgi:hypothetical protein
MVAVVPDDPGGGRGEHLRLKRRWHRARRFLPAPVSRMIGDVPVYEDGELQAAVEASILTSGMRADGDAGASSAVLFGNDPPHDESELRARPGLSRPTGSWSLIAGPERRPPIPPRDRQELRIAAWLELQFWWRTAFEAFADSTTPWAPYTCVKMVSEPARIWLALAGEATNQSRELTLRSAAAHLPEMAEAFTGARELLRSLPLSPEPPLSRSLDHLVALSERISGRLRAELAGEGSTEVRLAGDPGDLLLPRRKPPAGSVPLLDWRALAVPSLPDEALLPRREGITAGPLGDAIMSPEAAVYPALRSRDLMTLPVSEAWPCGILRAIQMPLTDPVSFALIDGAEAASFPDVSGWSAGDWARRAVAEHAAWLSRNPVEQVGGPTAREWLDGQADQAPPVLRALAKLITAARAGLFQESLVAGEPVLPLSVVATCRLLADRAGSVAEEAVGAYRAVRSGDQPDAPGELLDPLRRAVLELPVYADMTSVG